MRKAITILGPPVSGKSTLVKSYSDRAIQIGEYAHSLPHGHPLKERCMQHWKENTFFSSELLGQLLNECPFQERDWYLLDGTPRDLECIPMVNQVFDIRALIEVRVEEDIWLERVRKVCDNERASRHDSTLPQLLKRRKVYEESVNKIRRHFKLIYTLDNSRDIESAEKRLMEIVSEVFPK